MRGLIWFLPDFRDWPLAVVRGLHARSSDWSFCGIVTGTADDVAHVERFAPPAVRPLYFMDRLQWEWLGRPCEPGRLADYERLLGAQTLNRMVVADRTVGRGFVTGVDMPESPLMRQTRDHEARVRYLVGLLDFLFEVFETERPDVVFAPGVAGALAMALAAVSRHFGVAFRCLLWTRIDSRHTITESAVGLSPAIERRFQEACRDPAVVGGALDEARAIIAGFRARPSRLRDSAFGWQRALRPLAPVDMAALAWRTLTRRPPDLVNVPYPGAYFAWEVKRRARAFRAARAGVFNEADVLDGKRFAFYPLHRTPEASTMVLAPMLTDQAAVIEALAKSLPMETRLAVKEHVPMIGRRPPGFYARLAAIPKVVLISPLADAFDLIRRADLTCVVTGTAGWEAMLLKRPVLSLGRALYQTVGEGFVLCEEPSRLAEAIPEAMAAPPARDERLALYIASVLEESFDFPKKYRFNVTADTVAAHPEIADAMCARLLASLAAEPRPSAARGRASIPS